MLNDFNSFNIEQILKYDLLSKAKLKETVKGYSLGEKKKLAFLAAMISNPEYLIVDEVSNGVDIETLEILKEFLNELKERCLIIATGHHFEFYENIIDEVLILQNKTIEYFNDYEQGDKLYEIYKKRVSCHK